MRPFAFFRAWMAGSMSPKRLSDNSEGRLDDGERVADDGDVQLGGGERSEVYRQRPVTMVKEHSVPEGQIP
jgi:hypothetical protein